MKSKYLVAFIFMIAWSVSFAAETEESNNPFLLFWVISICAMAISNVLMVTFFKGKLSSRTAAFAAAFVAAFVAAFAAATVPVVPVGVVAVVAAVAATAAESKKASVYLSVVYYLSMLVALVLMYL